MQKETAGVSIMDAQEINRALRRIAHEIVERNPDLDKVVLVGIPSRGAEIAKRLSSFIGQIEKVTPRTGTVDVSMHRDDIRHRTLSSPVQKTELPFDLNSYTVILVDDVLYTGRTCRAAMDAISSFGRPAKIQFAVLLDRGHRELPIRADYVGKNLPTARSERVMVRFESIDNEPDSVRLTKS